MKRLAIPIICAFWVQARSPASQFGLTTANLKDVTTVIQSYFADCVAPLDCLGKLA
jgi:hypothetical protein